MRRMSPFLLDVLLQAFHYDNLELAMLQREESRDELLNLGRLEKEDKHFIDGDGFFDDSEPISA